MANLDRADEAVVTAGAPRLQAGNEFRVFVDPVGHLDLSYEDIDADRALLDRLGAIRLRDMSMHTLWADPAGHPFCG